ncbi:MAG: peptidoglycan-binding protein, partial [Cytophagales bacterium]|nr:peptidoglycan-binding protein [Cytophagales bacterium]
GGTIKISKNVLSLEELLGEGKTFSFVRDVAGVNVEKQLKGKSTTLLKDKVGKGKANREEDVKIVQRLLHNGNYEAEVNGKFDEKTEKAINKFMKDEFNKTYNSVDPGGKTMRSLRKFRYKFK